MKQIYVLDNSHGVIRTLVGLKSRIVSMYSRNWLVIAPMLFVAFGLFGVNVEAWGAWPTYSGSCNTSGYVLVADAETHSAALPYNKEYDLAGPGATLTFKAHKTVASVENEIKVYQYVNGAYENNAIYTKSDPGKVTKTGWFGVPTEYGYEDNAFSVTLNPKATKIKFVFAGSLNKYIKEVRVTRYSDNAYALYDNNLDCGSADYNLANSADKYTTGTAYVDWSHIATAPTCSISGSQASYFEVKTKTNTPTANTYGVMSIEVAYKHTAPGDHSATLNVGGKTITITGHTNKITPYIVTTPTVDTITHGQTISNSQLGTGLVKADLINAAGTVVPGTWTIDEKDQTVTTSGGSNATVHLTFTPTDGNTYNTIHTTQSMFVRSVATISWASAYSAEKPTVPVGKWIENAATTKAAGAVITYSSTSSDVEISADGHSFRFTAESEAEVVASHGVTATHGSASETKTFKSTYKAIQVIVWNDRFDRLTTEMKSKNLIAEVWIEDPSTGVRTYNATRTALLTYSVGDNTVVSIPANSTTLTIHKKGETTITATVAGNDQYESASVTMPVKVREPSAGCDDPLLLDIKNDGTNDYLSRLFSLDTDKPALYTDAYTINVAQGQVPDKLLFSCKGELFSPNVLKRLKGKIKAQERIGYSDSGWQDIESSKYIDFSADDAAKWYDLEDIPVSEGATAIRFYRPQGGEGYHYVRNVEVTMKHFIRTETPTVDFGNTIKVNSSEYKDVVVKYSNAKGALQVVNPFTKDVTVSDDYIDIDDCGAFGSATLRIFFSPTTATEIDDYIVIKDPVVGNSSALSIRVKADVQRADQTIDWNPETNISTIDQILLNGTTNGQEHDQMNVITYTVTNNDGVISVENNVVTILKPGTVTITASQSGSANYAAATSVEKNFTISAEPLTLVAPTAQDITYGQALSESTLTGGSAKDSKNNTVYGTFAWETACTIPNASDEAQAFAVVFTPSENAEWYTDLTTDANINVAKADPAATVENVSFAYGTKAEDVALDGTGDGEWSWDDERANQTLNVDVYNDVAVKFTPNDGDNYNVLSTTITLTVTKADPVAAANAVEITYGATASSVELSGTGVAGTWSWTDDSKDDVLDANTYTMDVHFVPTDAANYNEKDATVALTVNKATSVATPTAAAITVGQKVSESAMTNSGTAGTWAWDEAVANTTPAVGSYNYTVHFTPDNANYTTLTTTVSLQVNALVNEFTGEGDWNTAANWTNGIPNGDEPNVIVKGELIIDENVTVGSLTIKPEGGVTIIENGKLTVTGQSDVLSTYGDIHVKNDGALELENTAVLKVRNFTLDAKLCGQNALQKRESAASGQVDGTEQLTINGDVYFQISFDPLGKISYGWYDFTVPFAVNINDGIERVDSEEDKVMVSGVDFIIMEADEANRANGGNGWRKLNSGVLQPGKLYTITLDDEVDQNTLRFTWNGNGSINNNGASYSTQCAAGSVAHLRGWNGLGNGMLSHGHLATNFKKQVYNHGKKTYETVEDEKTFAVGTAFFIQVPETISSVAWNAAAATEERPLYAPRREMLTVDEFRLTLTAEEEKNAADQLWVSASEEATGEYVIGHDLVKMGTPTSAKVAQMWVDNNNLKLCDIEMPLVNDEANCSLGMFAPKAGSYELKIDAMPEDAALYLTYNDNIIWDLTASPYVFDLAKGTTNGYGLRIEAKHAPQVVTGIDSMEADVQTMRKVIIDNKVYVITPEGKMYDIIGKSVKY